MTVQLSRFTVYRAPVFFVLYTPWWKLKRRPYPWCNIWTTSIRVLWTPCQTATIISKLDSHWSSPRRVRDPSFHHCSWPSAALPLCVCVFLKVTVSCSSTYNSCPGCVISTQPVSEPGRLILWPYSVLPLTYRTQRKVGEMQIKYMVPELTNDM